MAPVHVVGVATTPFEPEQDAMLDELVFDVVQRALREAGLRKQDAGLAVTASMDVLDARSISSGLTVNASGGYLNDSYRVEGDSGLAIAAAAQAVAAGDVEVAIAVGVHNPEIRSADDKVRLDFLEQVSNLAFEPHIDRAVGLSAHTVYGLQAAGALEGDASVEDWAELAAAEISRGSGRPRAARRVPVTAVDVLASASVNGPLVELMLPAHATGAVAVVLASPARAGRCVGRSARITGIGHATGGYTWDGSWLTDPGAPTRRAADHAFGLAGLGRTDERVAAAEVSAPTPALHAPYLAALGLTSSEGRINDSGGLRSCYPGLANGGLRLLEVIDQVERLGDDAVGVAHSVDTITGTVSEDVTVTIVEVA
jgi:acetyl-CoA acetyltransferase